MKSKRNREDLLEFCGEVHSDDGIDPCEVFSRGHSQPRPGRKLNRKDFQLAKPVFRAIDAALRGELTDPVLQDLEVVSVQPAPDAMHFIVVVRLTMLGGNTPVACVIERLERARRFLRCQVAAAITRKRTPELSFEVIEGEEACS
jgi:ribosome-binding factor A